MVVEHAERFGLSQLHQLRGRISRGSHASTCVLVYQAPWSDDARQRLQAMAASSDGFVIAEKDLQIRGPGDFFGTRQSGLPQLRAGDLTRDAALLELAFTEARSRVEQGRLSVELQAYVRRRLGATVRADCGRVVGSFDVTWVTSDAPGSAHRRGNANGRIRTRYDSLQDDATGRSLWRTEPGAPCGR